MKNHLVFILFLLSYLSIKAQIEFAPVGATYYHLRETQFWEGQPLSVSVIETVVTGDTIIQGQLCSILEGDGGMNWPCNNEFSKIYMYQDSARVYYFNHGTNTFDLLYDFSKNAGESWEVPAFCAESIGCGFDLDFTVMVDSVSYQDLNGFSIKVQHTTLFNTNGMIDHADIYEGLGDLEHLFFEESWHCTTIHDWIRGLRCYDSPTDGLFTFFDGEGSCDRVVSTEARIYSELPVKIFPNPANDLIEIELSGNFDWFLYNVQGQLLDTGLNNQQKTKVDLKHFYDGLYLLKIKQMNKISVRKVIKVTRK